MFVTKIVIIDKYFIQSLMTSNNDIDPRLDDITIDIETVKKVISKLSNSAAIGLDRLFVLVYIYGGNLIHVAFTNITQ